ncbi:MaoC family dehydratase [Eisenibacter elegans]|jgi:acyl dehydratase|uniref:MaoC family dehydratase n=1 Tax=Eisenibacter elegans TaxID=997 RepID=UPI00042681D6|nr:MaoC family dehydratase [Eisenibacter elegans]
MIEQNQVYRHRFSFTQAEVAKFAEITGDKNPIHLDPNYAAQTPFQKPIMHGFLSASVFSKVFGVLFPGEGTIYLSQNLKFRKPMFVEQEYEAVFKVLSLHHARHRATIETNIYLAGTEELVLSGEAEVMNNTQI